MPPQHHPDPNENASQLHPSAVELIRHTINTREGDLRDINHKVPNWRILSLQLLT